jgi:quercetin dioxygenase-like cupin family protein
MSNLFLKQNVTQKLSSLRTVKESENLVEQGLKKFELLARAGDPIGALESYEDEVLLKQPQSLPPPNHYFGKNLYVREIVLKKGTIATGRVHKFDHVSIVLSGHMTVWTPYDGLQEVRGPCVTEVPAGTKRAGYAHEDTHWITAHSINDKDAMTTDEIFEYLTVRYYSEYIEHLNNTFGTSITQINTRVIDYEKE